MVRFSSPKPRKLSDDAFSPMTTDCVTPLVWMEPGQRLLSPPCSRGNGNQLYSHVGVLPSQPQTPRSCIPLPALEQVVDPMEDGECALRGSLASPCLPEPSVRNTFITFDSPLQVIRPRSPPKSVPASYAPGSVDPSCWRSPLPSISSETTISSAWPPCTPETPLFQPTCWEDLHGPSDVATLPIRLSDFLPDLPLAACFAYPVAAFASDGAAPVASDQLPQSVEAAGTCTVSTMLPPALVGANLTSSIDSTLILTLGLAENGDAQSLAVRCGASGIAKTDAGHAEDVQANGQLGVADQTWCWSSVQPSMQSEILSCANQDQLKSETTCPQILNLAMHMPCPQPPLPLNQSQHVVAQRSSEHTTSLHITPPECQQLSQQVQLTQQPPHQPLQQELQQPPLQQTLATTLQHLQDQLRQLQQTMQERELIHQMQKQRQQQHIEQQMQQIMQEVMQQHQHQQQLRAPMHQQFQSQVLPNQQQFRPAHAAPTEPPSLCVASLQPALVNLSELLQLPLMPLSTSSDEVAPATAVNERRRDEDAAILPKRQTAKSAKKCQDEADMPAEGFQESRDSEPVRAHHVPSRKRRGCRGGRMGPRSGTKCTSARPL